MTDGSKVCDPREWENRVHGAVKKEKDRMNTRTDYGQLAAKTDYAALDKKLTQLSQGAPPKRRKTVDDVLEPVREKLMGLHRSGWTAVQLVAELKGAGVPVSPARLRECLHRWIRGGNGSGKRQNRRQPATAGAITRPTASPPSSATFKKSVMSPGQSPFTLR